MRPCFIFCNTRLLMWRMWGGGDIFICFSLYTHIYSDIRIIDIYCFVLFFTINRIKYAKQKNNEDDDGI